MESSQSSSMPYSLSDIKLPESPGNLSSKSSKTVKVEDNSSKMDSSDNEATKDSSFEGRVSNGVSEADTVSRHGETSDSQSDDSSGKNKKRKKKHDSTDKLKNKLSSSKQSVRSESSSEEAVRNKSQLGGKTSKYKDKSSVDTEEQSKDSIERKQKVLKQQSEDSENESHSDCERSRMDSKHKSVNRRSKYSKQQSDDSENEKFLDSRHKSKGRSDRRRKSSRQHSEEREKNFESKHKSKDSVDKKKYSRHHSEDRDNEKSLDSRHKSKDSTDRRQKSSRHRSEDRENEKSLDSKHKSKSKDRGQKALKQKSEDRESEESLDSKHKDTDKRQQSEDRDNEKNLDSKHKSKDMGRRQQSEDRDNEKNVESTYKLKDRDRRQSEDREEKSVESKSTDRRQKSEDREEKSVDSKHKSKDTDRKLQSEDRDSEKSIDSKHKSKDNVSRRLISRQQFENSENESSGDGHNRMEHKPRSNDYLNIRQQTLKQQSDDSKNEKICDTEKEHGYIDSKQNSKDNEDRDQKIILPESESENGSNSNEHAIKDSNTKLEDSAVYAPKSPKQHSEDSGNEKSSDSGNLSSRIDSKHKLPDSPKVLRQRSHSQSSSSSHSSDSSSKRRRPKKSLVSKSNDFEINYSNQISNNNLAEKPKECDDIDMPKVSVKKRMKIKRDNISVENLSSNVESGENSASNKSVEKIVCSSHSVSEKPSIPESIELQSHEIPYVPRKVSLSNRKLNRKSSEDSSTEPKSKRSKWGSFASAKKTSQTISISTDSLKNWFPDFKLISEPTTPMEVEPEELILPAIEEKPHSSHVEPFDGNDSGVKQASTSQMGAEDAESQEPDMEEMSEQGPVSKIIFIQNLVRPFTLNQLKDLLKHNGKIVEEFFWIDKIKSKCFVMYETEKEACKARNALNNTRWPSSNPKILSVEYSNEEECEQHKKGNEPPPKPIAEPIVQPPEINETRDHVMDEPRRKDRERRKERERPKPQLPIREWDKDKIIQESPERELTKEEKPRSSEKDKKKESKKRPNEDTSAKLLDHLFQKTKSAPCIYWLPLTEEQAKQKEEAKKMRRLEREKLNQMKEQEEAERRNRRARSSRRSREKENRKSSTRSRSPVPRRR